jgi:hypothetical protein
MAIKTILAKQKGYPYKSVTCEMIDGRVQVFAGKENHDTALHLRKDSLDRWVLEADFNGYCERLDIFLAGETKKEIKAAVLCYLNQGFIIYESDYGRHCTTIIPEGMALFGPDIHDGSYWFA